MIKRKIRTIIWTSFLLVCVISLLLLLVLSFVLNNISFRIRPKFSILQQNYEARTIVKNMKEHSINLPILYWRKNSSLLQNSGSGTIINDATEEIPNLPRDYWEKNSSFRQNYGIRNIFHDIKEQIPNLPLAYWEKNANADFNFNYSCASFPDLFDINYNNELWQTLRTSNGTFHLYNAYLDLRISKEPTVRILAMVDRIELSVKTYCQFWYDSKRKPVIIKVLYYKYLWFSRWGNYNQRVLQPYLITCKLPFGIIYPIIVSLVEHPCNISTVALNIIDNRISIPSKIKDFAVCVKGLDIPYSDLSIRLAEWVELLYLLGVDKIFFYNLSVHPTVKRLLDYYERQGKVHVTRHMLAGDQPNNPLFRHYFIKSKITQKRQNELIPYNDCFYKHMYEYKYIVLLDTDEVIMPVGKKTWRELMDTVENVAYLKYNERGSYRVQNVYFLDDLMHDHPWFSDIPQYMHMLQHVYRVKNFTRPGAYVKSFFNTKTVLTLHNHNPTQCIGRCNTYSINNTVAQLQHYRSDCVAELKPVCDDMKAIRIKDTTIWKFKEQLIKAAKKTLGDLNLIPEVKSSSNPNDEMGGIVKLP